MEQSIFKSKDGIIVLYEYIPDIKGVVMELHFKAGGNNDPIGKAGLAHFCEHVLMGFSTKRHSREERTELRRKYQYFNASTSFSEMTFIACATNKEIDGAVDILTDPFDGIIYSQKQFESESKIISDEISTRRQTNGGLLALILDKNQAKNKEIQNHEYSPAGSLESLSRITLNDIKKFIYTFINKENLIVNVVGNITKDEVEALIDKYISTRIKPLGKKGFSRLDNLGDKGPHYYYSKPYEKGKGLICLDYKLEKREKTAFYDRRNSAVNGVVSGLLNEVAFNFFRQKQELCYSCSARITQYVDTTYFSFSVNCAETNLDRIIEVYHEFISSIFNEITEERFVNRINKNIGGIKFDQLGIFNQADKNYSDFDRFGELLGDQEYDYYENLYKSITYQEVIDKLKLIAGKKPNMVVISEDGKYADFDYNDYCNKIKLKIK